MKLTYYEFKYQEVAFLSRSISSFIISDYHFANILVLFLIFGNM